MTRALTHRGPDDEGLLFYCRDGRVIQAGTEQSNPLSRNQLPHAAELFRSDWSLVLGHRRFSIFDVSAAGHQPFLDAENRAGLVFNGAIYNYIELRSDLQKEGVVFHTRSDTEVLLQAYLCWGELMFSRLNGMWAFALVDFRCGRLLLSRDRVGERPLFFTHCERRLYFASEIKALFQVNGIHASRKANDARVWDFLYLGLRDHYPGSFYGGIDQFPPGTMTWVGADGRIDTKPYWQLPRERLSRRDISYPESAIELSQRLRSSVALRIRSDVPVAAELSGGMDSTSIVSLAADLLREAGGPPLQTITIRYPDNKYDESPLAKCVANASSTPWESICLEGRQYWEASEEMVRIQEQPYESPNQLGSRAMWRWMKDRGFRVVLSGGAGDELLAGYIGHMLGPFLTELVVKGDWQSFWREVRAWWGGKYLNAAILWRYLSRHLPGATGRWYLAQQFSRPFYAALRRPGPSEFAAVLVAHHHARVHPTLSAALRSSMGYSPMPMYMVHGDKLSMSVPIEVRFPFLDPSLMEFAFRLPIEYFIRKGESKSVLREAMRERLPETVIRRRDKMGFPVPLERWMHEGQSRIVSELRSGDRAHRFLNIDYISSNYDRIDPCLMWRIHQVDTWMRLHDLK
jgi:asparagine synthase (glutamine-hydrolysing)